MKALTLLLAIAAAPALADRYDRHVEIVNNTSQTMQRFFASHVDADDWEEDVLGDHTLGPWSQVTADIDDGSGYCLYDFRAVYRSGEIVVKRNVNVCEVSQWTIGER